MLSFVFGPLVWLKNYLSHIRETSWHYKLVHGIWGKYTSGKACTYYWLKFPSSVLAYIGIAVLVASMATFVFGGGWFFGYVSTVFKTEDPFLKNWLDTHKDSGGHEPGWYPYRYTSKGKKRHIFFPWQAALGGIFLALVYYLGFVNQTAGLVVGLAFAIVFVLGVIGFVASKGWKTSGFRSARSVVNSAWDKTCPPLIVEPKTAPKQSETA